MTSNKYICWTTPLGTSIRVFAEPQESSLSWYQLCYKQWATEMNRYNGDRSVCPHLRKSGRWWGASTTFCFQTAAFFFVPNTPSPFGHEGLHPEYRFYLSFSDWNSNVQICSFASKLLRCTLYHISLVLNYDIFDDAFFHSMQRFIISLQVTESHDDFSLVLCLVFELRIWFFFS